MSNAGSSVAFDPSGRAAHPLEQPPCNGGVADGDEPSELRLALAGDEVAFTALYRRHRAAVYRFVWLLTGSASQAADITQDVFIDLLSGSIKYVAARGSLCAYLCGVARFRAYRAIDTRMQSVDDFDGLAVADEGADAPALPQDRLERKRSLDRLYEAIRQLPPIFRDVLILVELQEMSYADVANVVGIELGTVRSRLSRAKSKLTELLNSNVG
jgi:RNA polymerase sigma-70 factor (ECF subfamily)